MKKFLLSLGACLFLASAYAQKPHKLVSPDLGQILHAPIDHIQRSEFNASSELTQANGVVPVSAASGKTAATLVNPVGLGRASNVYTVLRTEQNQVFANDSLDLVAFMHRQDVTVWGGGTTQNGKLRYDVSFNRGSNFTTDVGPLQSAFTVPARYPQMTGLNPNNELKGIDSKLCYFAPALNSGGSSWDGYVTGVSEVENQNTVPPVSTENYIFQGKQGYLPGGLCEGQSGEFWTVSKASDGAVAVTTYDSTMVYKGTWNASTQDIDWQIHTSITLPHNAFNGDIQQTGTNIAFSPDGQIGWICMLADLQGGVDTVFAPVFIKSTDAGATWGSPVEVDLSQFQHLVDSINFYVTIDSLSGDTIPAGSGVPTTAFDCDIVVDANGNPHMNVIIGNGNDYSIQSGLWKGVYDITSKDGGSSWDARFVSPCLTFRGEFGIDPNGDPATMDNYPQASRTQDGKYIFFSWTDSDTTVIGYQESDNLAPNLMISGYRITDDYRTCNYNVSIGDILWDGKLLWPTLAPTVLGNEVNTSFNLPIVFADMFLGDPTKSVKFLYVGNDAAFCAQDFQDPSTLNLGWTSSCQYFGAACILSNRTIEPVHPQEELSVFPNPSIGTVSFRLPKDGRLIRSIEIVDLNGRVVHRHLNSSLNAGGRNVEIDLKQLPSGIYAYRLEADMGRFDGKISLITK